MQGRRSRTQPGRAKRRVRPVLTRGNGPKTGAQPVPRSAGRGGARGLKKAAYGCERWGRALRTRRDERLKRDAFHDERAALINRERADRSATNLRGPLVHVDRVGHEFYATIAPMGSLDRILTGLASGLSAALADKLLREYMWSFLVDASGLRSPGISEAGSVELVTDFVTLERAWL